MHATTAPVPDDDQLLDVMVKDRCKGARWKRLGIVKGYTAALALTADMRRVEVWFKAADRGPDPVPQSPTLFD